MCSFGEGRTSIGPAYQCEVKTWFTITTREKAVIDSFTGIFDAGKDVTSVQRFYVFSYGKTVYFPRGLDKLFPSLTIISIGAAGIKEIRQSDLAPFPNLKSLGLSFNKIEVIEAGLFSSNPLLQSIDICNNLLVHIDAKVFDTLPKLTGLYLYSNPCSVNSTAFSSYYFPKTVIAGVTEKCQSDEFMAIDRELRALEESITSVHAGNLASFEQKFLNLQERFEKSNFVNYSPMAERFQKLAEDILNIKSSQGSCGADYKEQLDAIEKKLANIEAVQAYLVSTIYSVENSLLSKLTAILDLVTKDAQSSEEVINV